VDLRLEVEDIMSEVGDLKSKVGRGRRFREIPLNLTPTHSVLLRRMHPPEVQIFFDNDVFQCYYLSRC